MLNNLRGWQLKTYARVELKTGSSTYSITNVLCKIVMKQFCCVVENSMEMKQNREENDIIAEAFLFMCVVFWWHWNSHMWRYAEKRTFFGCFHFISALTIPFFVVCFHRKKQQQQQQIWLKNLLIEVSSNIMTMSRSFSDTYDGCRSGVNIKQKIRSISKRQFFVIFLFLSILLKQ